jgi:Putative motility protein
MDTDLVSSIVNFNQATLASKVQYAVAKKILDSQAYQGNAAVKLIQAAGEEASNGADELATAATGLGANLDTYG